MTRSTTGHPFTERMAREFMYDRQCETLRYTSHAEILCKL